MKNNKNRFLRVLQAVTMSAVMIGALAGCGSDESSEGTKDETTTEKELVGFYQSTQNLGFMSAYPQYTFKQATFGLETIEVYSDDTFVLTNVETNYSGTLTFPDEGEYEAIPRGANAVKYYGSLTSADEEGLLTLSLEQPTSIIANYNYATNEQAVGYVNTDTWTDEMGAAVGGEAGSLSADDFLTQTAYPEGTSLIVDTTTNVFEYVPLVQATQE